MKRKETLERIPRAQLRFLGLLVWLMGRSCGCSANEERSFSSEGWNLVSVDPAEPFRLPCVFSVSHILRALSIFRDWQKDAKGKILKTMLVF